MTREENGEEDFLALHFFFTREHLLAYRNSLFHFLYNKITGQVFLPTTNRTLLTNSSYI